MAVEDLDLRAPRVAPPDALAPICSTWAEDRAGHAYGKSFRDVVRAFHGDVPEPPDVVARPGDEAELAAVLDWCGSGGIAAVPYGAGSSVVGGVETGGDWAAGYRGVVSVDLARMDGVLEVDRTSRAARIAAGATGPRIEEQLRPAGAHPAPLPAVLRVLHPRRLDRHPLRRALRHEPHPHRRLRGVDPDASPPAARWSRGGSPAPAPAPRRTAWSSARRASSGSSPRRGCDCRTARCTRPPRRCPSRRFGRRRRRPCRRLAQTALWPTNCRLLDPGEAAANAGGRGEAVLVLGFESAHDPVDADMEVALEHLRRVAAATSAPPARVTGARATDAGGRCRRGVAVVVPARARTCATPWWRWAASRRRSRPRSPGTASRSCTTTVVADHRAIAARRSAAAARVTCRFTHVYPDGVAPYFTVLAPSRHGEQLAHVGRGEGRGRRGDPRRRRHDHPPPRRRPRPPPVVRPPAPGPVRRGPGGGQVARSTPPAMLNPGVLVDPA